VEFEPTCTVAVFKDKDKSEELQGRILEEGVPTRSPVLNLRTRMARSVPEQDHAEEETAAAEQNQLEQEFLAKFCFDNVQESEELAEELQFLNGRKYVDDGRLYEIYQLRYDPEFRKLMSGRTHPCQRTVAHFWFTD
jgi:phage/plasmid-associated DNA primase